MLEILEAGGNWDSEGTAETCYQSYLCIPWNFANKAWNFERFP